MSFPRQVPGCPAAQRPRPASPPQWPGVDPAHQDDAARAAEGEDLGGFLPPWAAVCLLPSTHHPLHLCQHPHLLVGVLSGIFFSAAIWSISKNNYTGMGKKMLALFHGKINTHSFC